MLSTVQCRGHRDLRQSVKGIKPSCYTSQDVKVPHRLVHKEQDRLTIATMLVNKGAEAKVLRYGSATYIVLIIGPSNQSGVV